MVLGAVFLSVTFRQLTGRGPSVWVLFLIGGLGTVATQVLSVAAAETVIAIQLPVFVFLFSLFLFAHALEDSGALDHLARWILGRARNPRDLPLVVFIGFGLLSGFLVNDALVLIGVPLLFVLARRLGTDARPLFLTLAFAVSVGSVLTPLGNPQNLLVSLSSGIRSPIALFLRYLALPTAANLLVGGVYVRWKYGRGVPSGAAPVESTSRASRIPLLPATAWGRRLWRFPVLWIFPVTLLVLLTTDITSEIVGGPGVPLYAVTFAGALMLLASSPHKVSLLQRVDWSILLLFAGLFIVVAGAQQGGVLTVLQSAFPIPPPGSRAGTLGAVLLTSLGGPQLVSNVPWVALQIPLLQGLGYSAATPVAWVALAAGSTLAGNVTLLGAASNLIVVERAERLGVRLGLREFVRDGLPLAAITVGILYLCLLLGL